MFAHHALKALRAAETKVVAEVATLDLGQTVRIEHNRKRIASALLASVIGAIVAIGWLVSRVPDTIDAAPWWALASLALAAIGAVLGMLRHIYRLQDGDPALVISPRGLRFRPNMFGEQANVPWQAIRGLKPIRFGKYRHIELLVENAGHFAERSGSFMRWPRPTGPDTLAFATSLSNAEWLRVEALLQRYFDRYGNKTPPQPEGTW
jgi:hypothetical protein